MAPPCSGQYASGPRGSSTTFACDAAVPAFPQCDRSPLVDTPAMKRRRRLSALAGILVAWFLAACATQAPSPSTPASDPEATSPAGAGGPSAEASGSAPPNVGETPDRAILQVVADELRVRAEAGTASTLMGTLERGDVVRVESGPVDADGFRWFEVVDLQGRLGWAADGDGTDPWLAIIPDLPDATPLLTLDYACDVVGPINPPATTVMDDGRVIATDGASGYGWTVRPLSAAGLEEVREGVLASPYLQANAEYRPQPRADAGDAPGHGVCSYTFTIPTDAEPIVVSTIGWFGDEEERTFYEPSPERKALDGLARNLIAIEDVLGDEAWEAAAL